MIIDIMGATHEKSLKNGNYGWSWGGCLDASNSNNFTITVTYSVADLPEYITWTSSSEINSPGCTTWVY